ncbi:MAG: hypothetical protein EOM44_14970 [Bacteroidia bacterium]|jgi:hypothetical protein|nr:hypothetical protein [Bacteroidia bacterium]
MKKRIFTVIVSVVLAFAGLACEMPEQEPLDGSGQKDTIFEYEQPDEDTQANRYQQEKKQNE